MSEPANRQALRPAEGGMLCFNIMEEATRLKSKPGWASADRLSTSLVKDGALNVLLMVLKKGVRLPEHRTRGPIAVHVISGAIRFEAGNRHVQLSPGNIVALDREVAHDLEALEESVVLLITAIG